jgi:hypothetical protein
LGNKCKEKYNKINTAVRQATPASRWFSRYTF